MEILLFENDKYQKLYNCTGIDIDAVPLENRRNILLGLFFIAIGVIEEVIYIPCMIVIWRRMKHSCYKIMFYMGVLDMLCLGICAIATGWLCIVGAVYCSFPILMYGMGVAINFFWPTESTVEILLAVDRCMEICQPRFGSSLFKGYRTWLWMVPITLYGVFMAMYVPSFMFSGIYSTWFFYPYVGYNSSYELQLQYSSVLHDVHDWIIAVTVPVIYLLLAIFLYLTNKSLNLSGSSGESSQKKAIFIQVALISAINSVTSVLYVYLQYSTDFSPFLALVAQFAWIQAHGFPPFIYLVINRSMRNDCKELIMNFYKGTFLKTRVHSLNSATQNQQFTVKKGMPPQFEKGLSQGLTKRSSENY